MADRLDLRKLKAQFDAAGTSFRERVDIVARAVIEAMGFDVPAGDVTPPADPTNLVAGAQPLAVGLQWDANTEPDLDYYIVERSLTGGGAGFSSIAEPDRNGLLDNGLTPGTTYWYRVAAVDISGNTSGWSNEANASAQAQGSGSAPGTPTDLEATPGDGSVELDWVEGTGFVTVSGYNVYRDVSSPPTTLIAPGIVEPYYEDNGVTNGVEYFYVVTAVGTNGVESAVSNEVSTTPVAAVDTTPPPVPTLSVTGGDEQVNVAIGPVYAPDLAGYKVYYGTSPATYTANSALSTDTRFLLGGLTNSTAYYFAAVSVDTVGNESAESTEVGPVTPAAIADVTPPDPPANFMVLDEDDGEVTIGWDENLEPDMDHYLLHVKLPGNINFQALATIYASTNTYQYTHSGLVNDQNYSYRIRAVDTSGNPSTWAGPISATPMGGTVNPPPPAGWPTIDGDTGLGPAHRSPDKEYNHIVNVSTYTGTEFAMERAMEVLYNDVQSGTYPADWTNVRVAVLLPEKDDFTSTGLWISPQNHWSRKWIRIPDLALAAVDFIGPWPTATLTDPLATAKAAEKKYKLGRIQGGYAEGGVSYGSGGFCEMVPDHFNNFRGTVGFCAIEWQLCDVYAVGAYASGGNIKTNYYGFQLVDFHNDYDFKVNPANGQQSYPKWFISLYSAAINQLDYCDFEGWWLYEHFIYTRSPHPCDTTVKYTTMNACGGQFWQNTTRSLPDDPGYANNLDPADPTNLPTNNNNGLNRGEIAVENSSFRNASRSTWSSAGFSEYGSHTDWSFTDCEVVIDHTGPVTSWPPTIATIRQDDQAAQVGNTLYTGSGNGSMMVFADGGTARSCNLMANTYQCNTKFTARRLYYFSKYLKQDCLRFNHLQEVDVEDSGFFSYTEDPPGAGINRISCGAYNSDIPVDICVNTFRWVNNNQESHKDALQAAQATVPSNNAHLNTPTFYRWCRPNGTEIQDPQGNPDYSNNWFVVNTDKTATNIEFNDPV